MKQTCITVKALDYLVDEEAYNQCTAWMLHEAAKSGDIEKISRVAFAFLVLCLGAAPAILIPMDDLGDVAKAIFEHFNMSVREKET